MNGKITKTGMLWKRCVWVKLGLGVLFCSLPTTISARQFPFTHGLPNIALIDSQETANRNTQQPEQHATGTISGKVVDQSRAVVSGAHVRLSRQGESDREATTNDDGLFAFTSVPPGTFQLTFDSKDLATQEFIGTLNPGQALVIPVIELAVATQVTEVRVGLSPEAIAEAQVEQQEKQRVFGLIPNFFVSYIPDAAPLTPKLKFRLAWKSAVDPVTFGAVGVLAGVEQAANERPGYGQGIQGYAKRYGAAYTDMATGTFLGGALLPSLLKQDPRYFYKGNGSMKSRFLHALTSSIICRGDNGRMQPNYSSIGGNLAAGAISTLYYSGNPGSHRNAASLAISTALIRIGETTVASIFQEFLVPKLTPNLPTRAPSQP